MTGAQTGVARRTTVDCYDFWDRVFRRVGVLDYTEGYYRGDPSLSYSEAQRNQIGHLLDQVGCGAGARILDVGCGNGTLLDEVRRRGATGVGVTISPQQFQYCAQRGLDVHLLDYRRIGPDWNGRFDAVIANGSMEHFVLPQDALEGQADAIYRGFFSTCHRLLDPRSASRKVMNTTIHFDKVSISPRDAMRNPWSFRWFSERFHYAFLVRGFGGYYPSLGQFERCARPYFSLLHERDATEDCHLTSEAWLWHGVRSLVNPLAWVGLAPFALRHPLHTTRMLFLLLVSQSWNWQFRPPDPPMKHLWQTWSYNPLAESAA